MEELDRVLERSGCNFKISGERRASKGREDRVERCDGNVRRERRKEG